MKKEIDELTLLGFKYHYNTETFDRIHPHGISPSGESAMPINRGASSANAYRERDTAMENGIRMGFTPQEVYKAIRDTSQYRYEEICTILHEKNYELNPTNY